MLMRRARAADPVEEAWLTDVAATAARLRTRLAPLELDFDRRVLALDTPVIVPADVAFMLVATALVLLMTPALAFFYGGLVRSKNALNTMMMSVVALGFVGVAWALLGYSLAFG